MHRSTGGTGVLRGDGNRWRRSDRRWLLALIGGGVLLLGLLEVAEPLFFLRDDNAAYHLPAWVHSTRSLVDDGELAQLNLHQSNGVAHLAVGQTAVFYPPVYLAVLLASASGDVRWAVELDVALHLLLGAAGLYFVLRRFSPAPWASAAGAFFWLSSPYTLSMGRGWVVMTHGGAHAVWGFLLLLRLLERPSWPRAIALAASKALFFLVGYPQLLIDATLFETLFLVFLWILAPEARRSAPRVIGRLIPAALLAGALAAPLLVPMLVQVMASARGLEGVSAGDFVAKSVDLVQFLGAQALSFDADEIARASSSIYYVGIPVLAGAVIACVRAGPMSRAAGLVALTAFVCSTKAWGLLYGLPVVSSFRWPVKHYLFFLLFLSPLVAVAAERLARRRPRAALALVVLILGPQIALVVHPGTRTALGPITLRKHVETYRSDRLLAEADRAGRFATFRRLGSRAWAPELLTHDWATLFEFLHVSGYEPMRSRAAHETSFQTDFATFNVLPAQITPALVSRLGAWGVDNLVAPTDDVLRKALLATGVVRLAASNGGIDLYRNLAARPIVEDLAAGEALPARTSTNAIVFEHHGDGTAVRVAVTPLDGWTASMDGVSLGRPPEHPAGGFVVGLPPGRHRVELRYATPGLGTGLIGGALGLLVVLASLLLHLRHRSGGGGGSRRMG